MTEASTPTPLVRSQFFWNVRLVRVTTGVVLFAFAATHLLNHALGLISIDVMEDVRVLRVAITRSWPGTIILATSLIVHIALGLRRFARRRVLQMKLSEAIQLLFGICIPLLLFKHIIGMRFAHELYGVNDNYVYALFVLWPNFAIDQFTLITLVWVHGCIGLHVWLAMRPWYQRALPVIFAAAIIIPVMSYAGFSVAGRAIREVQEFSSPFTSQQYSTLLTS